MLREILIAFVKAYRAEGVGADPLPSRIEYPS